MRLTFGDMTREVNVFNLRKQPRDIEDQTFQVNLIENLTSKHREELELETDCDFESLTTLTLIRLSSLLCIGPRTLFHQMWRQQI